MKKIKLRNIESYVDKDGEPYGEFYKHIGKELGLEMGELDVCKVVVHPHVGNRLAAYVKEAVSKQYPGLPRDCKYFKNAVGMHFLCYGPKESKTVPVDEIWIEETEEERLEVYFG